MALCARKFSSRPLVSDNTTITKSHRPIYLVSTSGQGFELKRRKDVQHLAAKFCFSKKGLWHKCQDPQSYMVTRGTSVFCWSDGSHNRDRDAPSDVSGGSTNEEGGHQDRPRRNARSSQGIAEACKFVRNDAKFVNERASNDMYLLTRGIMCLDARARRDVALLGLEILKLDARAREDTEKIDRDVKEKAEHLHQITTIFKNKAQSKLQSAADKHWSDGALEADLRRADIRAKQRAKEDAFMALEFVKNIHDRMVSKVYKLNSSLSSDDSMGRIMLEKNGKALEFFLGEVSTDRISAIQEAYFCMAAALSEADGIDYTDPEELELLVTTLIGLDAMDGKSSVSLLLECSSSPDVSTRKALANALATAPSMWTLGNAGMGALQRLSEDSNPAIAVAASRAINELKEQFQIEEGDTWRFTRSLISNKEDESEEPEDA